MITLIDLKERLSGFYADEAIAALQDGDALARLGVTDDDQEIVEKLHAEMTSTHYAVTVRSVEDHFFWGGDKKFLSSTHDLGMRELYFYDERNAVSLFKSIDSDFLKDDGFTGHQYTIFLVKRTEGEPEKVLEKKDIRID